MENGQIHQQMVNIMKEVDAIGKDSVNKSQGFKFRGIDDVMNTLHSVMAKHEVYVTPELMSAIREERESKNGSILLYSICDYKFTFHAVDGSTVSAVVRGEGMDSGDKASNKAISIALKYALLQVFMIPTEELVDPDIESHAVKGKTSPSEIDKKLMALPEDVKAYLKKVFTVKSAMIDWCNVYEWNNELMKKAISEVTNGN